MTESTEITIGQMKFTSTVYENYKAGCGVEMEIEGGYYGETRYEDFDAKDVRAIIEFMEAHEKRVDAVVEE